MRGSRLCGHKSVQEKGGQVVVVVPFGEKVMVLFLSIFI